MLFSILISVGILVTQSNIGEARWIPEGRAHSPPGPRMFSHKGRIVYGNPDSRLPDMNKPKVVSSRTFKARAEGTTQDALDTTCIVQVAVLLETVHQYITVISQWLEAVSKRIKDKIEEYPKVTVEFALASFSDYPGSEDDFPTELRPPGWQIPQGREQDIARWGVDLEGCYSLRHPFGTPLEKVISTMAAMNISQFNTVNSSSALTAIARAASDRNIGWRNGSQRLIIFASTNGDSYHPNEHVRVEPEGNGEDTCQRNKPPSLERFGKILRKSGVSKILGVVGEFNDSLHTHERFDRQLYTAFNRNRSYFNLFRCPTRGLSRDWGDLAGFRKCTEGHITSNVFSSEITKNLPDECLTMSTTTTKKTTTTTRGSTTTKPTRTTTKPRLTKTTGLTTKPTSETFGTTPNTPPLLLMSTTTPSASSTTPTRPHSSHSPPPATIRIPVNPCNCSGTFRNVTVIGKIDGKGAIQVRIKPHLDYVEDHELGK